MLFCCYPFLLDLPAKSLLVRFENEQYSKVGLAITAVCVAAAFVSWLAAICRPQELSEIVSHEHLCFGAAEGYRS